LNHFLLRKTKKNKQKEQQEKKQKKQEKRKKIQPPLYQRSQEEEFPERCP
jgi:hypothetical protein